MSKGNPDKTAKTVVFLIMVIALSLRWSGISHGFPFIFHPDEPTIIRSALGIRFNINPEHFDWPHFYIYFNYGFYMLFARLREFLVVANLREVITRLFPLFWNDEIIFYYITRVLSAALGALTVIPVYLAGKELFNRRVGLYAALAFAVLPFHVWHSHYALPDVPMVFLVAWGLYFATKVFTENDVVNYAE